MQKVEYANLKKLHLVLGELALSRLAPFPSRDRVLHNWLATGKLVFTEDGATVHLEQTEPKKVILDYDVANHQIIWHVGTFRWTPLIPPEKQLLDLTLVNEQND
jgi:hypothetical protein